MKHQRNGEGSKSISAAAKIAKMYQRQWRRASSINGGGSVSGK